MVSMITPKTHGSHSARDRFPGIMQGPAAMLLLPSESRAAIRLSAKCWNVLCEVGRPWEQPLPKAVSDNRGKARKIPALRDTDVFWPWPLIRRDFLQPVWK